MHGGGEENRRRGFKFSHAVKPFRPLSDKTWYDGWMTYQQEAYLLASSALHIMGEWKAEEACDQLAPTHTNWPGRMQWLDYKGPQCYSIVRTTPAEWLEHVSKSGSKKKRDMSPMPGVVVVGTTKQKDLHNFLQPLVELIVEGAIRHVFVTQPPEGRKEVVDCHQLADELRAQGTDAEIIAIESVDEALAAALSISIELDEELPQPVLCIGSIYLIGAILQQVEEEGFGFNCRVF
ncbi:MAG: hypothetical protein Ct9H90mP16_07200 [Candidatus Poseidoniales archaeon]|nr:MAG: hypothetical protein Ct9H90mP16_07200 [Candidatus Poseidoniales archaeon]